MKRLWRNLRKWSFWGARKPESFQLAGAMESIKVFTVGADAHIGPRGCERDLIVLCDNFVNYNSGAMWASPPTNRI